MDNKKDDFYYISKLAVDIDFIITNTSTIESEDELSISYILIDSIMFRLISIADSVKKLSTDFKKSNANIPWIDIVGLRNRIVHDYDGVDFSIIYNTVKYDLPDLIEKIKKI